MSNGRYLAFTSLLECAYLIVSSLQLLKILLLEWYFPDGTVVSEYCSTKGAKCSPMAAIELGSFAIAYVLMLNIVPCVLMVRATMMHASIFFEGKFQDESNMASSKLIRILGLAAIAMRLRLLVFVLLALSYFFEFSVLGILSLVNVQ